MPRQSFADTSAWVVDPGLPDQQWNDVDAGQIREAAAPHLTDGIVVVTDFNVLFTSAGRRVSLLHLFRKALNDLSLSHRLITADLQTTAPAHFVADANELVPRVTHPSYLDCLKRLCLRHRIHLLVPLIDTELHFLAPHREAFQAIGTTLLVSSPETIAIGRDKRTTDAFFQREGIPAPRLFDRAEVLGDSSLRYPCVVKPADGSAGIGVTRVDNAHELGFFVDYVPNAVVQEFVEGKEYTLDILVDFTGRVRCVVPRLRMETRAGEVSKGMTVRDPTIIEAGRRVAEALPGAVGCLTLQCFHTADGRVLFIELNPRFGGGFPLAAAAGADFPRWIVEWMIGRDPDIAIDGWRDGLVMLRYDEGIFVDREAVA